MVRDAGGEAVEKGAPHALDEKLDQVLAALEKNGEQLTSLGERIEVVEKETPGRQTTLGGDDVEDVEKSGKGYRGLDIGL